MATLRKDGRWQAEKRTPQGRVTAYGKTPEEAHEGLDAKVSELQEIRWTPPKGVTLHDYAGFGWFPTIANKPANTRKRYEGAYKCHVYAALGQIPLHELSRSTIQDWVNRQTCAPKTTHFNFGVLKQILELAVDDGVLDRNPARRIELPRVPEKRHRIMEAMEAAQVLERTRESDMGLPVFLALCLGLRQSEVAGLRWSDFNRITGTLSIVRQRQAVKGRGVIDTPLKSRSSKRVLYLPKPYALEIDALGNIDSEYICTRNGLPWIPNTIGDRWREIKVSLGLADWHYHDLRHLAAGLLHASGASIMEIAAVLGHANASMSMEYTSLKEGQTAVALERVAAQIVRQPST